MGITLPLVGMESRYGGFDATATPVERALRYRWNLLLGLPKTGSARCVLAPTVSSLPGAVAPRVFLVCGTSSNRLLRTLSTRVAIGTYHIAFYPDSETLTFVSDIGDDRAIEAWHATTGEECPDSPTRILRRVR